MFFINTYSGIAPFFGLCIVLLVGFALSAFTLAVELLIFHYTSRKGEQQQQRKSAKNNTNNSNRVFDIQAVGNALSIIGTDVKGKRKQRGGKDDDGGTRNQMVEMTSGRPPDATMKSEDRGTNGKRAAKKE